MPHGKYLAVAVHDCLTRKLRFRTSLIRYIFIYIVPAKSKQWNTPGDYTPTKSPAILYINNLSYAFLVFFISAILNLVCSMCLLISLLVQANLLSSAYVDHKVPEIRSFTPSLLITYSTATGMAPDTMQC